MSTCIDPTKQTLLYRKTANSRGNNQETFTTGDINKIFIDLIILNNWSRYGHESVSYYLTSQYNLKIFIIRHKLWNVISMHQCMTEVTPMDMSMWVSGKYASLRNVIFTSERCPDASFLQ